jgi:uncharacterized protein (DUF2164 family)
MSIFINFVFLLVGGAFALAVKMGVDYYNDFIKQQQLLSSRMEDILVNFKAIEKVKEIN